MLIKTLNLLSLSIKKFQKHKSVRTCLVSLAFKLVKMMFAKLFLATCFVTLNLSHLSRAETSPQDILDAHNTIRAEVGVCPLVWNETLASYAQNYANKRSKDCMLEHSYGPYGENLAIGCGNGVEAVQFWVTENDDYDHESNKCISGGEECLHYSQIVSRNSVQLGCGTAKCADGRNFFICSYDPIGNIDGERPY